MRDAVRPLLLGMGRFSEEAGGLNRHVLELAAGLERHGAAPAVVVARGGSLGRRLLSFSRRVRAAAPGADVVDAHFALYAFLPLVLGLLRRKPLVVHFHGPWAAESRAAGERSRLTLGVKHVLEGMVYRRADEVVTMSAAFKRIAVEEYGVQPWRVTVVPPGVDLDRFSPGDRREARRKLGVAETARVVLAVRRLVPRTGVAMLLESWHELVRDLPGAVLVIAGDGPERGPLERRARALGIGGSVRFAGRVAEDELVEWYRAADVAAVPSLELEGYGLVVLEALACGTPVVATDLLGLREALAPLDAGLLVPAGDARALAARLRDGLAGERPFPSSGPCRRFAEEFSWDRVAATNLEVYARARARGGPRPLRVVYVDHCARLSGAELSLLRLLPWLRGVEPHVLLGEDGPLVSRLLAAGISTEVLPMSRAARDLRRDRVRLGALPVAEAWGSAVYAARLARRLRRLRPDLVHTNSLKAAIYGAGAARLAGVPVVWHLRDTIAEPYLPPSAVRLVRRLTASVDFILANSEATLASLGRLDVPRTFVPSAVVYDPSTTIVASGREHNGVRIGMVGRIAPWKGQDVFLRAFAQAFPAGAEQATIVGAPLFGEDEYDRSLRALAVELGIGDRVEFTGFREDVAAELARLDALVHASVLPEPFGQVVVEGMSAGLPVIASAAGGPVEIVEDGRNGLLFPPGDVDALAELLRRVIGDPELRLRLGRAAKERVKIFSPETVARKVTEVYELVLGESRAAEGAR